MSSGISHNHQKVKATRSHKRVHKHNVVGVQVKGNPTQPTSWVYFEGSTLRETAGRRDRCCVPTYTTSIEKVHRGKRWNGGCHGRRGEKDRDCHLIGLGVRVVNPRTSLGLSGHPASDRSSPLPTSEWQLCGMKTGLELCNREDVFMQLSSSTLNG